MCGISFSLINYKIKNQNIRKKITNINKLINEKDFAKSLVNLQALRCNEVFIEIIKNKNSYIKKVVLKNVPKEHIDMRTIEHSLCEWDKYERVRLGQGRPRSKYVAENTLFPTKPFKKGAVD